MLSKLIHNPTKPFEILNKLLSIYKIQAQIKQNMMLECFWGSWGRGAQGRRKDAHTRWGDCTFFVLFADNCCPMADLRTNLGGKIGPKTMQKYIPKSMPKSLGKSLTNDETILNIVPNSMQNLNMFWTSYFSENMSFSLVLQLFS